jgi:hypothetical protein
VGEPRGGIKPGGGLLQGRAVHIGREDRDLSGVAAGNALFVDPDRKGVDLLAGGAADTPDPQFAATFLAQHRTQHLGAELGEGRGIAEELGDADQQIAADLVEFGGVAREQLGIGLDGRRLARDHAARDAALDGGRLVVAEFDPAFPAQQIEDPAVTPMFGVGMRALHRAGDDAGGERGRIAHRVDRAAGDRGLRHARIFGGGGGLGEHEAAGAVHGARALGAVVAVAGEDHRHGARARIGGEGAEKQVDGVLAAAARGPVGEDELPAADGHEPVVRDDVDGVGAEQVGVFRAAHRHGGVRHQQFLEETLAVGREMLHDDEGAAGIGRQRAEESGERAEPACGGADPDNQFG